MLGNIIAHGNFNIVRNEIISNTTNLELQKCFSNPLLNIDQMKVGERERESTTDLIKSVCNI